MSKRSRSALIGHRVQIAVAASGIAVFCLVGPIVRADPPTVVESLPNSALDQTDSFMGMRVGDQVRLKCTEPEIELNNARLLAINKTTVVVSSATGERYTLPKDATTFEPPVNWKRTTTVFDENNHSSHQSGGWFWLLLLLVGAGAGGWFWFERRRKGKTEGETTEIKGVVITAKGASPTGKFKLSPMAPRPALAVASPSSAETGFESDSVEDLIEARRYGTATERLEQQIKMAPDDFKLRLQLLKVYSVVSNRKQMERVLHQIEFHPAFSPEQKQEAGQIIATAKEKESAALHAPPTQPPPVQVTSAQPVATQTESAQSVTAPAAPPLPPVPAQPTEAQIRAAQMKEAQAAMARAVIAEAAAAHAAAVKAKAAQAAIPPSEPTPPKAVQSPTPKPATTETAVTPMETDSDEAPRTKPARRAGASTRKATKGRQKSSA